MRTEFMNSLSQGVGIGFAQAGIAAALCMAVVFLCRRFAVRAERETLVSLVRGLIQMALVGVVLALLLHGKPYLGILILLGMTVAAAVTASRRAVGMQDAVLLSFFSIATGSGIVISCRWAA
jgi:putative ABC transport system permease protein